MPATTENTKDIELPVGFETDPAEDALAREALELAAIAVRDQRRQAAALGMGCEHRACDGDAAGRNSCHVRRMDRDRF